MVASLALSSFVTMSNRQPSHCICSSFGAATVGDGVETDDEVEAATVGDGVETDDEVEAAAVGDFGRLLCVVHAG